MGHESISTTAGYGKADFESKRRAAILASSELERRLQSQSPG